MKWRRGTSIPDGRGELAKAFDPENIAVLVAYLIEREEVVATAGMKNVNFSLQNR